MKTRIIHTKIHFEDDWFGTLTKDQRYMFIYYFTNSHINLSGIYQLSDRVVAMETNSTEDEIKAYKRLFEKANKVFYHKDYIFVVNAQRYGGYVGLKTQIPLAKELNDLPKEVKQHFKDSVSIGYPYSSDTTINHKSEIINNKSKTINHKSEPGMDSVRKILKGKGIVK